MFRICDRVSTLLEIVPVRAEDLLIRRQGQARVHQVVEFAAQLTRISVPVERYERLCGATLLWGQHLYILGEEHPCKIRASPPTLQVSTLNMATRRSRLMIDQRTARYSFAEME